MWDFINLEEIGHGILSVFYQVKHNIQSCLFSVQVIGKEFSSHPMSYGRGAYYSEGFDVN